MDIIVELGRAPDDFIDTLHNEKRRRWPAVTLTPTEWKILTTPCSILRAPREQIRVRLWLPKKGSTPESYQRDQKRGNRTRGKEL